jgi:cystathionine beta-lyase/cystathionine gamma-synthase
LITHPATTTHAKVPEDDKLRVGIRAGTVRLSVGLEDTDDLIDDLAGALAD